MSQVVLITGCSTGIGRDLAQRLTRMWATLTPRSAMCRAPINAAARYMSGSPRV
jgi:NAD(P)-dependent dehydrogenase (short-subunit alcohol dehydrogenase family)